MGGRNVRATLDASAFDRSIGRRDPFGTFLVQENAYFAVSYMKHFVLAIGLHKVLYFNYLFGAFLGSLRTFPSY